MTVRKPIVYDGAGNLQQLQAGDSISIGLDSNVGNIKMNGVAAVGRTLQVETQDGHKVVLYLDGLKWSQDVRRNTITARPKDMIEIVSETLGGGNVTP